MGFPVRKVQACEATPCKGLWQWQPRLPPAEEETTQQLLLTWKLLTQNTPPCSFALLFRVGAEWRYRLRETGAHTCTFIAWRFLCYGRKASVPAVLGAEDPPWALKSMQDSSQQITDPQQNFVSGGEKVWQNKVPCGEGNEEQSEKTFLNIWGGRSATIRQGYFVKLKMRRVQFSLQTLVFQTEWTIIFPTFCSPTTNNLNRALRLQQPHPCVLKATHPP